MSDVRALNFIRPREHPTQENAFLTKLEANKVILCITLKFVGSGKVKSYNVFASIRRKMLSVRSI
jgi:hypothetical protein